MIRSEHMDHMERHMRKSGPFWERVEGASAPRGATIAGKAILSIHW